jgi:hypothetical protein
MSLLNSYKNRKLNIVIEHSPTVLESLNIAPSEVLEAFKKEVFNPLYSGKFVGDLVSNPCVSKDVFCVYITTGHCILYEVATSTNSSTPGYPYTYCSVIAIADMDKVDSDSKTLVSTVRRKVGSISEPLKQFITANTLTFYTLSIIAGVVKFFM